MWVLGVMGGCEPPTKYKGGNKRHKTKWIMHPSIAKLWSVTDPRGPPLGDRLLPNDFRDGPLYRLQMVCAWWLDHVLFLFQNTMMDYVYNSYYICKPYRRTVNIPSLDYRSNVHRCLFIFSLHPAKENTSNARNFSLSVFFIYRPEYVTWFIGIWK